MWGAYAESSRLKLLVAARDLLRERTYGPAAAPAGRIRVAEPGSIPEAVSAARDLTERLEAAARTWRSSTVEERHALMQAVKAMRAAAAPAAPKSINAEM